MLRISLDSQSGGYDADDAAAFRAMLQDGACLKHRRGKIDREIESRKAFATKCVPAKFAVRLFDNQTQNAYILQFQEPVPEKHAGDHV